MMLAVMWGHGDSSQELDPNYLEIYVASRKWMGGVEEYVPNVLLP